MLSIYEKHDCYFGTGTIEDPLLLQWKSVKKKMVTKGGCFDLMFLPALYQT